MEDVHSGIKNDDRRSLYGINSLTGAPAAARTQGTRRLLRLR